MSCRETPGNSAITSYARLAAEGSVTDRDVQQAFHDLKRRASATHQATQRPDVGEVHGFLDHQAFLVRNDPTLSALRKTSLLERLSRARAEASANQGPDGPTLAAWKELASEVQARAQYAHFVARTTEATQPANRERLLRRLG